MMLQYLYRMVQIIHSQLMGCFSYQVQCLSSTLNSNSISRKLYLHDKVDREFVQASCNKLTSFHKMSLLDVWLGLTVGTSEEPPFCTKFGSTIKDAGRQQTQRKLHLTISLTISPGQNWLEIPWVGCWMHDLTLILFCCLAQLYLL